MEIFEIEKILRDHAVFFVKGELDVVTKTKLPFGPQRKVIIAIIAEDERC